MMGLASVVCAAPRRGEAGGLGAWEQQTVGLGVNLRDPLFFGVRACVHAGLVFLGDV